MAGKSWYDMTAAEQAAYYASLTPEQQAAHNQIVGQVAKDLGKVDAALAEKGKGAGKNSVWRDIYLSISEVGAGILGVESAGARDQKKLEEINRSKEELAEAEAQAALYEAMGASSPSSQTAPPPAAAPVEKADNTVLYVAGGAVAVLALGALALAAGKGK